MKEFNVGDYVVSMAFGYGGIVIDKQQSYVTTHQIKYCSKLASKFWNDPNRIEWLMALREPTPEELHDIKLCLSGNKI